MPRTNTIADVFKHINMHNGDTEPCWEWRGKFNAKDQRPYFTVDGFRQPAYAVSLIAFKGPKKNKDDVARHKCDNGTAPIGCCNPHHLEWGTKQDNSNDMVERERHGLPKIVVRAIRKLLSTGETQQSIADLYGVSREAISAISTGRSRSSVDSEGDE
jgi:DNA-binding XRE family transcriptional regulator